jgi:hypothetical protein
MIYDNIQRNCRAFHEALIWFIHSQIIIATIERPSRTSPGAQSLVDALHSTNAGRSIQPDEVRLR